MPPTADQSPGGDTTLRRALFIVHSYPPSTNVAVQRTSRFIRYLPSYGWCADVVAPGAPAVEAMAVAGVGEVARAPEWLPLKAAVRARNSLRRLLPGGTPGTRVAVAGGAPREADEDAPAGRSLPARIIDPWFSTPDEHIGWYPRASRVARAMALRQGSEVLYTSGPPHSAHLIALRLQRSLSIPWVADFRDPWSRRPWLAIEDRRGLRYAAQVRMEAAVIAHADRVVLNTVAMADEFRAFYPHHASKLTAITNGYDPDAALASLYHAHPPADVLTLTHAGSLYRRRDPCPLLEGVARACRSEGIPAGRLRLNFLGNIDPAFGVAALVRTLGLEDVVRLQGRVSHEESLRALWTSHVLVLLQPGTHLQVPAKLFEYMQTARAILALTPAGATADIIQQHRLGSVVEAEDAPAIARAIAGLWRRFAAGESLTVDAGTALQAFDGRVLTGSLARLFDAVAVGR
jgi:glycosyltransferase involved in cell wall biosynthesis